MGDESTQVIVRMPLDLRRALEKHAEANERTLAQTVRLACKALLGWVVEMPEVEAQP